LKPADVAFHTDYDYSKYESAPSEHKKSQNNCRFSIDSDVALPIYFTEMMSQPVRQATVNVPEPVGGWKKPRSRQYFLALKKLSLFQKGGFYEGKIRF